MAEQLYPIHSGALTIRGCCPECRRAGSYCPACGTEIIRCVPEDADLPFVGVYQCPDCELGMQVTVADWSRDSFGDSPGQQLLNHLQRSWDAPAQRTDAGGQSNG